MPRAVKITIHVVLFVIAFIVFYLGLGIGLSRDPTIGTALWALAAVIAIGNFIWIARSRTRNGSG